MDIQEHAEKFRLIIEKYGFDKSAKAEELTNFLMKQSDISAEEFSKLFVVDLNDSKLFLSFIAKGVHYKQHHLQQP